MDEDDLREFELALDRHGALSGEDSGRLIAEVRRVRRVRRVRSVLQPGDHLERYGDAIYLTTPDPRMPKGRRCWYVITVEPVEALPNVERIVSVEPFDPLKHDHH